MMTGVPQDSLIGPMLFNICQRHACTSTWSVSYQGLMEMRGGLTPEVMLRLYRQIMRPIVVYALSLSGLVSRQY